MYAGLTEEDAAQAIKAMLMIEIDKTQVAKVGQAVSEYYDKRVEGDAPCVQTGTNTNGESVGYADENPEEATKKMEGQEVGFATAKGFVGDKLRELDAGGMQLQFNTVSKSSLQDAQIHRENHDNLLVRVAGFSTKFILLGETLQNQIIERTK